MKNTTIAGGVWPTMITPYKENKNIDYAGLEKIIEWYIQKGVQGLFAVCQSSEMFCLSLEERTELARFILKTAAGRIPVIASGHISESIKDQVYELEAMADTGVQAVVLVSNRLAGMDESDDVWKRNAETILNKVPVPLGIYECPYPCKRLVAPQLLKWCAETERFLFLKDTCCDLNQIAKKLEAVRGTGLQIYNANAATLLNSLQMGAAGYCGVMANFHPDFYVWLCRNWSKQPDKAVRIQNVLGLASAIEYQYYPVNAKYHMRLEGINISTESRVKPGDGMTLSKKMEVEQLRNMINEYRELIGCTLRGKC
jgi:4-hydroxy-tetrahydrodipicolinate synthase